MFVCTGNSCVVASDVASSPKADKDDHSPSTFSYHHAYLHAEIKPKNKSEIVDATGGQGFNILITAMIAGVWNLEEDPENYTCEHLAEMKTVKEETLHPTSPNSNASTFYKR